MGIIAVLGWLAEAFSAIQGEGPYVGCRQLFVRLSGCNWNCSYCDTPATRSKSAKGRVEKAPGSRDFAQVSNPIGAAELMRLLTPLQPQSHQAVSLTGGEPLLQVDFLLEVLPWLRQRGAKIYLETNGTLVEQLGAVGNNLDIIAMDLKLTSATGMTTPWERHARFLKTAVAFGHTLVKMVVTANTSLVEMRRGAELTAAVDPALTLILQPVTPLGGATRLMAPSPEQLLLWQDELRKTLADVRVIPQVHRLMGQL